MSEREPLPLFRTDDPPDEAAMPSLRAFLSQRLQAAHDAQQAQDAQAASGELTPPPFPEPSAAAPSGQRLNQLDVEMAASLEQYLPTASIRLRVTRQRLLADLATLDAQILAYESLPEPPAGVIEQVATLRARRDTLRTRLAQVEADLGGLTQAGVVSRRPLVDAWTGTQALWRSGVAYGLWGCQRVLTWMRRQDPRRARLEAITGQLQSVSAVLAESTRRTGTRAGYGDEIDALVRQFDRLVAEADALRTAMAPKPKRSLLRLFRKPVVPVGDGP